MNKFEFLPNLTLEQAKDMISKWQRKYDDALHQKYHAQSIAFDLKFPDRALATIDEMKAVSFYWSEELKIAIEKRNKMSQELQETKAEMQLLKLKLKKYEKEG